MQEASDNQNEFSSAQQVISHINLQYAREIVNTNYVRIVLSISNAAATSHEGKISSI